MIFCSDMSELKIKKINKPKKGDVEEDIGWFCSSLGLCSGRDTEFTSTRIITDILNKIAEDERVFSESIARDVGITQGLVNHHLRNLINAGVLVREKKQISIKGGSLKQAIKEMRRKALNMLEDIEEMAEEIDNELGIENR